MSTHAVSATSVRSPRPWSWLLALAVSASSWALDVLPVNIAIGEGRSQAHVTNSQFGLVRPTISGGPTAPAAFQLLVAQDSRDAGNHVDATETVLEWDRLAGLKVEVLKQTVTVVGHVPANAEVLFLNDVFFFKKRGLDGRFPEADQFTVTTGATNDTVVLEVPANLGVGATLRWYAKGGTTSNLMDVGTSSVAAVSVNYVTLYSAPSDTTSSVPLLHGYANPKNLTAGNGQGPYSTFRVTYGAQAAGVFRTTADFRVVAKRVETVDERLLISVGGLVSTSGTTTTGANQQVVIQLVTDKIASRMVVRSPDVRESAPTQDPLPNYFQWRNAGAFRFWFSPSDWNAALGVNDAAGLGTAAQRAWASEAASISDRFGTMTLNQGLAGAGIADLTRFMVTYRYGAARFNGLGTPIAGETVFNTFGSFVEPSVQIPSMAYRCTTEFGPVQYGTVYLAKKYINATSTDIDGLDAASDDFGTITLSHISNFDFSAGQYLEPEWDVYLAGRNGGSKPAADQFILTTTPSGSAAPWKLELGTWIAAPQVQSFTFFRDALPAGNVVSVTLFGQVLTVAGGDISVSSSGSVVTVQFLKGARSLVAGTAFQVNLSSGGAQSAVIATVPAPVPRRFSVKVFDLQEAPTNSPQSLVITSTSAPSANGAMATALQVGVDFTVDGNRVRLVNALSLAPGDTMVFYSGPVVSNLAIPAPGLSDVVGTIDRIFNPQPRAVDAGDTVTLTTADGTTFSTYVSGLEDLRATPIYSTTAGGTPTRRIAGNTRHPHVDYVAINSVAIPDDATQVEFLPTINGIEYAFNLNGSGDITNHGGISVVNLTANTPTPTKFLLNFGATVPPNGVHHLELESGGQTVAYASGTFTLSQQGVLYLTGGANAPKKPSLVSMTDYEVRCYDVTNALLATATVQDFDQQFITDPFHFGYEGIPQGAGVKIKYLPPTVTTFKIDSNLPGTFTTAAMSFDNGLNWLYVAKGQNGTAPVTAQFDVNARVVTLAAARAVVPGTTVIFVPFNTAATPIADIATPANWVTRTVSVDKVTVGSAINEQVVYPRGVSAVGIAFPNALASPTLNAGDAIVFRGSTQMVLGSSFTDGETDDRCRSFYSASVGPTQSNDFIVISGTPVDILRTTTPLTVQSHFQGTFPQDNMTFLMLGKGHAEIVPFEAPMYPLADAGDASYRPFQGGDYIDVMLTPFDDTAVQGPARFTLTNRVTGENNGYEILDPQVSQFTMWDNDSTLTVSVLRGAIIYVNASGVPVSTNNAQVLFTLSEAIPQDVTVNYIIPTATSGLTYGLDYTIVGASQRADGAVVGSVTIASGSKQATLNLIPLSGTASVPTSLQVQIQENPGFVLSGLAGNQTSLAVTVSYQRTVGSNSTDGNGSSNGVDTGTPGGAVDQDGSTNSPHCGAGSGMAALLAAGALALTCRRRRKV